GTWTPPRSRRGGGRARSTPSTATDGPCSACGTRGGLPASQRAPSVAPLGCSGRGGESQDLWDAAFPGREDRPGGSSLARARLGRRGEMRSSRWCAVVLLGSLAVAACSRSATSHSPTVSSAQAALSAATAGTATTVANQCANAQLQATDVGVTPTTITIEVMADAQPPQAPGLFQGNIDAINAFAAYVN